MATSSLSLLIASLLAVALPAEPDDSPDGPPNGAAKSDVITVTGVATTADGTPAAGVRVTVVAPKPLVEAVASASAVTDADGRYVLPDLPHPHTQLVWLMAKGPDGAVGNQHVNLWPRDATTFDSKLAMVPGGRLSLTFTDADGAPVEGVRPKSTVAGHGMERFILTREWAAAAGSPWPASDAEGRLTLGDLPAGEEMQVAFDPPGQHRQITDPLVVSEPGAPAAPDPIAVTIRQAGLFEVRIDPGEGAEPLPRDGYLVRTHGNGRVGTDAGTYEERSLDATPDGQAVIALKLPASGPEVTGSYRTWNPDQTERERDFGAVVTVTHPDLVFVPSSLTARLNPGERKVETITALRRTTVTGRLVDPATGEPQGGAPGFPTVDVYIPAPDQSNRSTPAGVGWKRLQADQRQTSIEEDGRFTVGTPRDKVRLVAKGRGSEQWFPGMLEVDVPPEGFNVGDVPLARMPELTGTVVNADGEPVPRALVWTTHDSAVTAPATAADANGRFTLRPESIPASLEGRSSAEIAAFDPLKPFAGTAKFTLIRGETPEPATVRLEPREIALPPGRAGSPSRDAFSGRWFLDGVVPELTLSKALAPDGTPTDDPPTLKSLRGRWVLLNFTSALHDRRNVYAGEVRAVAEAFADRLTVVTIYHSSDTDEQIVRAVARQPAVGITADDVDGATQRAFGVHQIPTYILLDPEGRFQKVFVPRQEIAGNLPKIVRQFITAE
ncbi:hypothetical protein [Alienimonas chondri]|uniref:Thioredoxin domain-containing protein n=1 Tax=Alienimonas chondri TaxID=2681879 RepID=A0ABX1VIC8_9PLAN|nr:hypothetical protein [Alienimonas chondri]NNJ27559.1 hypothetical protein [Alienimonas chondri]